MSSRKRKRIVSELFQSRLHYSRVFWQPAEDRVWLNIAFAGRKFASSGRDRWMQQDFSGLRSNLSSLIEQCSDSDVVSYGFSDATERKQAVNVQIALHVLGHHVGVAVAAAVWRHHSSAMMAGWMSGAQTVASAKRAILSHCTRKPHKPIE